MRCHRSLLAATASMLLLAVRVASAQPVYIFDEAPSLEQLRSIVIPESTGGLSRSIVLQDSGSAALPSPVMRAASTSTAPAPAPRPVSQAEPVGSPRPTRAALAAPQAAPEQPSKHSPEGAIVGFRINFAFDSAVVPPSGQEFVDRIAELMKEAPDLRLRVEGHTDAKGSAEYNLNLSKRRALSVAEYLVTHHGIAPDRFEIAGKGMSEPLVEDGFDPRNRRVQFVRVN